MRVNILLSIPFILLLPIWSNSAVKLKIDVNTNILVSCVRGYLVVKALNENGTIDTNWNGMVEVKSSYYLTVFRNEFEERDYEGKITFFLTNGQIQMGNTSGKRGIGFWDFEPKTITLTASDISDNSSKLMSDSITINVINFNSPYKIIINEIMYKTVDDSKYEWLELYNNSSQEIPLNNFVIRKITYSSGNIIDYTLSTSYSIKPKSFAIICKKMENLNIFFPDVKTNNNQYANVAIIENTSIRLVNDDAPLFLLDLFGNYCDGFIYRARWGNTEIPNISLERKDPNKPAYLKENWAECISTEYWNYGAKGTPGKENSIVYKKPSSELKINIALNKKVFSPKEDSWLEITYTLTEPADVTVKLFNSDGYEIMELVRHQPTSGKETKKIRFYGKDKNNKSLSPGIYILYFEALNSETGKTSTMAKSFVIGNKL